jgi:hypothetical protein
MNPRASMCLDSRLAPPGFGHDHHGQNVRHCGICGCVQGQAAGARIIKTVEVYAEDRWDGWLDRNVFMSGGSGARQQAGRPGRWTSRREARSRHRRRVGRNRWVRGSRIQFGYFRSRAAVVLEQYTYRRYQLGAGYRRAVTAGAAGLPVRDAHPGADSTRPKHLGPAGGTDCGVDFAATAVGRPR